MTDKKSISVPKLTKRAVERLRELHEARTSRTEYQIDTIGAQSLEILGQVDVITTNEVPASVVPLPLTGSEEATPYEAREFQRQLIDDDTLIQLCSNAAKYQMGCIQGRIDLVGEGPEVSLIIVGTIHRDADDPKTPELFEKYLKESTPPEGMEAHAVHGLMQYSFGTQISSAGIDVVMQEMGDAGAPAAEQFWRERKVCSLNRCITVLSREMALKRMFPVAAIVTLSNNAHQRAKVSRKMDGEMTAVSGTEAGDTLWFTSIRTLGGRVTRGYAVQPNGSRVIGEHTLLDFDEYDLGGGEGLPDEPVWPPTEVLCDPFSYSGLFGTIFRVMTYSGLMYGKADMLPTSIKQMIYCDGLLEDEGLSWRHDSLRGFDDDASEQCEGLDTEDLSGISFDIGRRHTSRGVDNDNEEDKEAK